MPKIKITDVSKCSTTGIHVVFNVLVNDSIQKIYSAELEQVKSFLNNIGDRDIALVLMYAKIIKDGAITPAQIKTSLLNQEWEW